MVRHVLAFLLAVLAWWFGSPSVRACGNAVEVTAPDVQQIERAERELLAGNVTRAFELAYAGGGYRLEPYSDSEMEVLRNPRRAVLLVERALRVAAIAAVRLEGRVNLWSGRAHKKASRASRIKSLRWANDVLVDAYASDKSPLNHARMAEAFGQTEAQWANGLARLRELARQDLMPEAAAWAALALLEQRDGDLEAARAARDQCLERAGANADAICGSTGQQHS